MVYVVALSEVSMADVAQVGGKNASLGEMIQQLGKLGVKVPLGFATTADGFYEFLRCNQLQDKIKTHLQSLDINRTDQLQQVSQDIRQWILSAALPQAMVAEIQTAYAAWEHVSEVSFAIRSSATAEDLPEASFAGQQETVLNVRGIEATVQAVLQVYASLYTARAISYRIHHGFHDKAVAMSVGVQQMVRSDLATSGVMFSVDTQSGFDQVVMINAAYGLGELVVQGQINPDEYCVFKPKLNQHKAAIIRRELGSKQQKMRYASFSDQQMPVEIVDVEVGAQQQFALNDNEILALARMAIVIEDHYGKPMDIEWAKDGHDQQLYIVQARPETVTVHTQQQVVERYQLLEQPPTPLVEGCSVGPRIGHGRAHLIADSKQLSAVQPGEVLVTDMTDPDWEPIMEKAAAIVTNRGGRTCHAAIVARELGVPAVIGCGDATEKIKNGQEITVSCAQGDTGFIYPGILDFNIERTEIDTLPKLNTKLCMNLANPQQAFMMQAIPNDGVGLARLEFIISNMIGIHPNALLQFDQLPADLAAQIKPLISAYDSPTEFYIEKLTEGIATIAAAFYPKPVIVRFSDFKTNEYANLLGGDLFEPREDNPMLGFRGASRYLSEQFHASFVLECEALLRVRQRLGLSNAHVMFPFVRTVNEVKQLVAVIAEQGLVRGDNGLQIYMMCEVPSNVILAEDFLEHVDGFSIGSNDLTQLTLGLDRDSERVAPLFDERDAAVKSLLAQVISACHKHQKYVGICGQGPSDHPDLAQWLVQQGIDSLSLNPDTVVSTWLALAELEA